MTQAIIRVTARHPNGWRITITHGDPRYPSEWWGWTVYDAEGDAVTETSPDAKVQPAGFTSTYLLARERATLAANDAMAWHQSKDPKSMNRRAWRWSHDMRGRQVAS